MSVMSFELCSRPEFKMKSAASSSEHEINTMMLYNSASEFINSSQATNVESKDKHPVSLKFYLSHNLIHFCFICSESKPVASTMAFFC